MQRTIATGLLLSLLVSPSLAAPINLPGVVTYRERIALPDNAMLRIELIDLALPDRPRVSVEAPTGPGQVPLAFTLTFEDSLILPQHDYVSILLQSDIKGRTNGFDHVHFSHQPKSSIGPSIKPSSACICLRCLCRWGVGLANTSSNMLEGLRNGPSVIVPNCRASFHAARTSACFSSI